MNTISSDFKKEINVINVPLEAELEVLVLSGFVKEFKKLRSIGCKNFYYLMEIPKHFVNGSYSSTKKYSIQLAYNKHTNHKTIVIDLDESSPVLSINNRRKETVNFPKSKNIVELNPKTQVKEGIEK